MESAREQNYWPGFVDALSNVVLTLVFVLVVFVFALVVTSNKLEKKAAEILHAQEDTKSPELKSNLFSSDVSKQAVSDHVKIEMQHDKIVLTYPPFIADLGDKAMKEFDKQLEAIKAIMAYRTIEIRSSVGREPYSAAHRLAYYRALNVRNRLIRNKLGTGENISSHIVQSVIEEDGRAEIIFRP
jgi:hypothetical protein